MVAVISSVYVILVSRAHKNGRLEEEYATPIEAHSPVRLVWNFYVVIVTHFL